MVLTVELFKLVSEIHMLGFICWLLCSAKMAVVQALGFAILAFSCVVKVPQILAVAQSKSAEGLAPISFELEQIGLSIHTAYGWLLQLPFNTYGEAAIICVQNTFLLAQIYIFSKAPLWRSALLTTLLALAASALLTGMSAQLWMPQCHAAEYCQVLTQRDSNESLTC